MSEGPVRVRSDAPPSPPAKGRGGGAAFVALGILLSRLIGLVRQRVFAHYLGSSDAADAFNAAFRIPNLLQNLFGEGVLSASFIPVYARLLARGDEREAGRVAGAVAGLLALVTATIVLVGMLATPLLIDLIAPGFEGGKRALTIRIVRVLFPGMGLLVLSAWCLGILNSHRRFFLSYAAPVAWNVAMIGTLLVCGGRMDQGELAVALAWGSVAGSALQFGVQVPAVLRLARGLRFSINRRIEGVRTVLTNFVPVFIGRGVSQLSAYIDAMLASLLGTGAVSGLAYAQVITMLPVSLFGMAISAAELPAMSGVTGSEREIHAALRERLTVGLRRIAFFVVPSAVLFLTLGDTVAATLYQSGRFTAGDARYVWVILAGSSVGLLASTMGRLYASTFYALGDTRSPLKYAVTRVILTAVLGVLFSLTLPGVLGLDDRWGVAGLTASAGIAGWVEFYFLRRRLGRRIGPSGVERRMLAQLWGMAFLAAAVAWGVRLLLPFSHPIVRGVCILLPYGGVYLAVAAKLGLSEVASLRRRLLRR